MTKPRRGSLKKSASRAMLAGALAAGAVVAASLGGAGVTQRAEAAPLVPAINVTQSCGGRVAPGALVEVSATIDNTGDARFIGAPNHQGIVVDGDAGTPDNTTDDFVLLYDSGDTNNDNFLDPGETWKYTGSYHVGTEDSTNVVGADAVTEGGQMVSDLDPCTTDVIQPPVPGVIVGVTVVKGKVFVKKPGTNKFVEITGTTEIPIGSQVDTTKGTLRLTSSLGGGRTNAADFFDGIFQIFQRRARNSVTLLKLVGGNFRLCGRSSAKSVELVGRSRRPIRHVWGSGKGRFSTQGRASSATVRGTRWLTQDQCNGTLTRVVRGIVLVRDFKRRKNVFVRAGHSYLARL